VYAAGPLFYLSIAVNILILSIIASCISSIMVMLAVVFSPAGRIRSLFVFLGLFLFLLLFLVFRLVRPERLVDPDAFVTLIIYMKNLRTPVSPYLPSTWAFDSMKAFLSGSIQNGLFHITLSGSFAVLMIFVNIILADAVYFNGVSKSHAAPVRLFKKPPSEMNFLDFLPGPVRAFAIKEIKTFFRDQTQWSQIFLIGALIMIYIYNFKVLPLEKAPIKTIYLQNLLSFLNMGLAAFVLTSVAARFAYPAVSTEKEAFWLVKAAPIRLRSFLWIKFIIYFLPLLVLTEVLIAATNILLQVTPFMMVLSLTTVFFMVPGIVSMGIGLGAAYPDFKSENPAQTVTSFGGLLYMMLSAGYIGLVIIIEAGPVYNIFMAGVQGRALSVFEWVWVIGSFMLVFILNILAIVLPMVFGEKRLSVEMI
jgi:ABC-2 type transport system permease protein